MKLCLIFVIFVIFISVFVTNFGFALEEENFTFFLDKSKYNPRDVIEISGWVKSVNGSNIFIEIINPDDEIILQEISPLKEIQEIDHTIPTFGKQWNVFGFYQIKLFYGNETQSRIFSFGDFDSRKFEPKIILDKEIYSWTDTVKISILSPNDNQNNNQKDKIKIKISSSLGSLSDYVLKEKGPSYGVFEGEVTLTGNSDFDVNGDGRKDEAFGYTFGAGPDDGNLAVRSNDNIKVSFSTPYFDETVDHIAKIQFQKGKIEWLEKEFDLDYKPRVRVTDPDLKLSPISQDKVEILVSSYPQGYSDTFTLSETKANSGVFEGFIRFIYSPQEDGVLIRSGSIVFAKYVDRTLPPEYSVSSLDIIANATVTPIIESNEPKPKDEGIDIARAEKLIELGNYYGLLSYSSEILLQFPNDLDGLFYKGLSLWGIGSNYQATEYFDKVLEKEPTQKKSLYYKSNSLYKLKKYDEALAVINKVIEIDPQFKDAKDQKNLILAEKERIANHPHIPSWVKNVAEFWCQDKINDASFIGGIQYLIDNNIIIVSTTTQNQDNSQGIPEWIKNNACWWSYGLITDQDFASGIEYLISNGILIV